MGYLCKIIAILALGALLTSFFWSDDEEKQLRTLHQTAEAAIKNENFEEAKRAYGELIGRIGVNTAQKYSVDWPTYIDIVLRYAKACEELNDMHEGEKALARLIAKSPPLELLGPVQLMHARFTAQNKSPGEAFIEMKKIPTLPETWKKEDLSFFHALEYSLNDHYDQLIRKAKRYLVAGFYNEAISLYEEIIQAIESGHYPKAALEGSLIAKKIRYRLAEAYYSQANFEQSLMLCYNTNAEDRIDREMIYLSALCYREKKEYEKALGLFKNYTLLGKREDLDHFDNALFEIGLFYYKSGNHPLAKSYFEQLQGCEGKTSLVSALYLSRIYLQESSPQLVVNLLEPLLKKIPSEDPLKYECHYLLGEASYSLEDFTQASECFEKSIPAKKNGGGWINQAHFHLGWCYIKRAEHRAHPQGIKLLQRAEEIFKRLLKTNEEEAAALSLARLYLLRGTAYQDPHAFLLVEPLLSPFSSCESFLLRAEAAQNYGEKEKLLGSATHEKFKECEKYADAWYERGLNHFQEGLKTPEEGSAYFEKATQAFANSFRCEENRNLSKAASLLKLEATANAYRNSPGVSLTLLDKLLTQFQENAEEREETLYLTGLIASRMLDASSLKKAESSLQEVAKGNGRYRDQALYALGTFYFDRKDFEKAQENFVALAESSPASSLASEAWFWAAEAAEKIGSPGHALLRAHVYQEYPHAERAADAYFRQFTYDDYLSGNHKALNHLKAFPHRFPTSPFCLVVYYLLGMHEEHYETAKSNFEEALKAFPLCLNGEKRAGPIFIHFRYQAILELSKRHLEQESYEEALYLLQAMLRDFATANHPLASQVLSQSPYPQLYEEAEYTLVQVYLKLGKCLRAQERLNKMLCHFGEAGIKKSYYLSHVWREQGKLAHQCNDYDTALRCFEIAEECGQGYLSDEQKLLLWILQSHAYRGKKEYDVAMRLLSKVINTDIASPLRLKAMFYRAEVYELQGRPELAVRQLEAMAKKGGDWALQAQEKLRDEYGI